ncbi:hypothetical protein, partial [Streptomyces somaliensis]|uniref:hypothetical protein n=1 Tax=Streptomyces somaliensis TaxID=78355 RepID=UPI001319FF49
DGRGPVHLAAGAEFAQDGLVQPPPQPVPGPCGEPAMGGGRRDTDVMPPGLTIEARSNKGFTFIPYEGGSPTNVITVMNVPKRV